MAAESGRSRNRGWALGLLALLALGPAIAAETSPLLEHVDQKMIDIGAQLTNAKKKLRMSPGMPLSEEEGRQKGLGFVCCEANLRTIAQKLRTIRAGIERLAAYYAEQENGQAMGILGQMEMRLDQVSTGGALFGQAQDEATAQAAMLGLIRPWNEFRNGVQSLRLCCPVPIPVEEGDGSGEPAHDDEGGPAEERERPGE
jgi:hypothetical protein